MSIREILEDLYRLDPALKSEEDKLEKIIEKLIAGRPAAEADEEFRKRLREQLLAETETGSRGRSFFVVHRRGIVSAAAGLAAVLVLVTTIVLRPALFGGGAEKGIEAAPEYEAEFMAADEEILSAAPVPEALKAAPRMKRSNEVLTEAISEGAAERDFDAEEYQRISENEFMRAADEPLSTFSVDVDTASYSNVRRFLSGGMLPPPDAVRIEELVNYFTYDYPRPADGRPFSVTTELAPCPWAPGHHLLMIGLQGLEIRTGELPPSNLVFLVDASGSMEEQNKLPLLKESLMLLTDRLGSEDRISIVAYAGAAGLVLPPVSASEHEAVAAALDNITAGGSTAGGEGIELAYRVAAENFIEGGNNRVILATDGDFNVGRSSESELVSMIEERRDDGIFLTVLGLGMGNYKDSRMESLSGSGNGNYAYIDTIGEARKVLVNELSSTLFTIAKDVKIQLEFNPSAVDQYRLIGYENRVMAAEDFDDDRKDAGEIGAGHSVTALYEIIPSIGTDAAAESGELAHIKLRYKDPEGEQSLLTELSVPDEVTAEADVSDNLRFAAAVAEWGLVLRGSVNAEGANIGQAADDARRALGRDEYGYRAEFLELLTITAELLEAD